ncbi:MAG: HAD family acid phosphatase, partial [bacterium]
MSHLRALLGAVAAMTAGLVLAVPAQAMVVPVDPGPIVAGRPIWGSGQNLMSVNASEDYWVGPGFAEQITAYYESGQARADQRDVSEAAYRWIRDWVDAHCGLDVRACRATVVFDVDETLLSNVPMYVAMDPQYSDDPDAWISATMECTQPANAPVRRLYDRVKAMGLTIVVLTGREVTLKPWTRRCLVKRGVRVVRRLE